MRFSSKADSPAAAVLQALGLSSAGAKKPAWKHTLLYDGEHVLWHSSPSEVLTVASLLWRYGGDLWRSQRFVGRLLEHFDRCERLLLLRTVH